MNVAKLENCRELYELSGWGTNSDFGFYWSHDEYEDKSTLWNLYNWSDTNNNPNGSYIPAYTLGELLRKLPYTSVVKTSFEGYDAQWIGEDESKSVHADTPENAICQLAIELFKQDVLTKRR